MPTWMPMALRFGTCTGKCRVGRDEIAGFGVRWRWGRGCGGRAGGFDVNIVYDNIGNGYV